MDQGERAVIAVIEQSDGLHIILHTGRKALHVQVTSYCARYFDASDGVVQVPDRVVTDNAPWRRVSPGPQQGAVLKVCQTCVKNSK